jgi:LPXTG-motif cell wall-anchored protein
MKKVSLLALLMPFHLFAQEAGRQIEPGQETSFTNKDLLLLALAGLAILMAIYFLFRKARKKR